MSTYNGWQLLEAMPDGWKFDKSAGSPLHGYEFVTNGKSVMNGQQRALLLVLPRQRQLPFNTDTSPMNRILYHVAEPESKPQQVIDSGYVRTVNELARQQFKLRLLADIRVDLMICELEGWLKSEYISELRKLLNDLGKQECIHV
jgi:hypothetical protein